MCDEGDADHVLLVALEGGCHLLDALAQRLVGGDVAGDSQEAAQSLVADVAANLEQGHGGGVDPVDDESGALHELLPSSGGHGAGVDVDGAGQVAAQLGVVLLVDVVGGDAELVDGVAPAGTQDAGGLGDDGGLPLVPLHGKHGLADDDVGAGLVQAGVGGLALADGAEVPDDGGHSPGGVGVAVDGRVGGGVVLDDLGGGAPQARGELDDAGTRQAGMAEHGSGQGGAAGAQDALASAGQDPVAGSGGDGTVGVRQRKVSGGGGGSKLLAHKVSLTSSEWRSIERQPGRGGHIGGGCSCGLLVISPTGILIAGGHTRTRSLGRELSHETRRLREFRDAPLSNSVVAALGTHAHQLAARNAHPPSTFDAL